MAILLYTARECAHCAAARQFLASRGVSCVERDITREDGALRELVAMTGQASVPALVVGRSAMVGFDEERWAAMLASC
jgi:glutaredoxin